MKGCSHILIYIWLSFLLSQVSYTTLVTSLKLTSAANLGHWKSFKFTLNDLNWANPAKPNPNTNVDPAPWPYTASIYPHIYERRDSGVIGAYYKGKPSFFL